MERRQFSLRSVLTFTAICAGLLAVAMARAAGEPYLAYVALVALLSRVGWLAACGIAASLRFTVLWFFTSSLVAAVLDVGLVPPIIGLPIGENYVWIAVSCLLGDISGAALGAGFRKRR